MQEPAIAAKEPVAVDLKEGETYWWCYCGLSKNQPFCDGSHAGTPFEPVKHEARRDRTLWMCTCKRTKKPPYCDGSHNDL